jgi:hypothetical protein
VAAEDLPLEIRWQAEPGLTVTVDSEAVAGESPGERLELPAGQPGPAYRLARDEAPAAPRASVADELPAAGDPRPAVAAVPRTAVDLAIDEAADGHSAGRQRLAVAAPRCGLAAIAGGGHRGQRRERIRPW